MDARDRNSRFSPAERCAIVLVVLVLAAGLWQGYGSWLLSAGGGDAG
jgi:hypothetical protein